MKGPFGLIVSGAVAVLIAIIVFGVVIGQLDTAMTTANSTTNTMTGLYDIMGIWGIVLWVGFMAAGMSMIGAGIYTSVKSVGGAGGGRRRRR